MFDAVSKLARAAFVSGITFLLCASALYFRQSSVASYAGRAPMSVYEMAFGERSLQPAASALAKLRAARSGGSAPASLISILEDISSAHGKAGASSGVAIETLRYGSEGADILGTAKGNDSIQRFRAALEESGYNVRTDNIQTVPGGNMRFNMNISGGTGK